MECSLREVMINTNTRSLLYLLWLYRYDKLLFVGKRRQKYCSCFLMKKFFIAKCC